MNQALTFTGCLLNSLHLLLIVATPVTRASSHYKGLTNQRAVELNLLLLEEGLKTLTLLSCARRCDQNRKCTMFLHNSSKLCFLYGVDYVRLPFPQDKIPSSGFSAYYLQSECPYSFIRQFNKCIYLRSKPDSPLSEIIRTCASHGGTLLQFRSRKEFTLVRNYIKEKYPVSGYEMKYYIGASAFNSSRMFVWNNSTRPLPLVDDFMWGSGQPDGTVGSASYCVVMDQNLEYLLDDVSCQLTTATVCQIDMSPK